MIGHELLQASVVTELCMNAEIGAYQPEPDREREVPPVLEPHLAAAARERPESPATNHAE
jgi:hypothetical protein